MMELLKIRPAGDCRWDCVSLGEVMLRFDPGEGRVRNARQFRVWEGGGEYNVSRGLRRCFGLRTTHVTAIPQNDLGLLLEDLMLQGGVDLSHVRWVPYDGIGRSVRQSLNFVERGFGVRGARSVSDRGHSAPGQIKPGDIDWKTIFAKEGARWFHTGGIFAALSETTPAVIQEAMEAARAAGTIVSYDLNYRGSLWKSFGGQKKAVEINRTLAPLIDVMIGNEEDFSAALGFEVEGVDENMTRLDTQAFRRMIGRVREKYPNLKAIATTLRGVHTATINDWGAVLSLGDEFFESTRRERLEIMDRVGGGDSFASGLIFGFLSGKSPQECVEYGAAHGALAMTTPGDTSMSGLDEVERLVRGGSARVQR
jgi:2-dehydro-3-deoxygluconokinase